MHETMAVHLRLTDKVHDEAKENALLSNEFITDRIKTYMEQLSCTCVFFCTDSATRKAEITAMLASQHIHCITYDATLSENENVGLHFSEVRPDVHLMDVALEVALMATRCKVLLCSRSNMSFMIAALADEEYQVIDMLSEMRAVNVHAVDVNADSNLVEGAFVTRFGLGNKVEGMWLERDICAVQIYGSKCEENLVQIMQCYIIVNNIADYTEDVDQDTIDRRLNGFLDKNQMVMVVAINKVHPKAIGWGLGQNVKTRRKAAALSALVPYLLDKRGGECPDNQFVDAFLKNAAANRPAAAVSHPPV